MCLKVLHILLIIFIIINLYDTKTGNGVIIITFDITPKNNQSHCQRTSKGSAIETEIGNNISIGVKSEHHVNFFNCTAGYNNKLILNVSNPQSTSGNTKAVLQAGNVIIENDMQGPWLCNFHTLQNISAVSNKVEIYGNTYMLTECRFDVTLQNLKSNTTTASYVATRDPNSWIYIVIGTVLTVIILIQMAVIIYCKVKARRVSRIETFSLREQNSDNPDNKRYSATPRRGNGISRLFSKNCNKHESGIYETLNEVQMGSRTPPIPPVENIPTLKKKKKSEADITNRPPLPVPVPVSDRTTEYDSEDEVTNTLREIVRLKTIQTKAPTEEATKPLRKNACEQTPHRKKPPIEKPKVKPPKVLPSIPRTAVEKNPAAPTSTLGRMTKPDKPGPAMVASELDNIFKKRQNPGISPSNNPVHSATEPLLDKPNRFDTNSKIMKSEPVKNITPTPSPQSYREPRLAREKPAFVKPVPASPVKNKPLPSLPVLHPPQQPQAPPLPVPNSTPQPLEPVYEAYDEEEVYNEEWNFETLPQYNLYSM